MPTLTQKNEWRGDKITRITVTGGGGGRRTEAVKEEVTLTKIQSLKNKLDLKAELATDKHRIVRGRKQSPKLVKFEKRDRTDDEGGDTAPKKSRDEDADVCSTTRKSSGNSKQVSSDPCKKTSGNTKQVRTQIGPCRKTSGNTKQSQTRPLVKQLFHLHQEKISNVMDAGDLSYDQIQTDCPKEVEDSGVLSYGQIQADCPREVERDSEISRTDSTGATGAKGKEDKTTGKGEVKKINS